MLVSLFNTSRGFSRGLCREYNKINIIFMLIDRIDTCVATFCPTFGGCVLPADIKDILLKSVR